MSKKDLIIQVIRKNRQQLLEKCRFSTPKNTCLKSLTRLCTTKISIEDNFTLICIYIFCNNNTPTKEFCRAARGENIVFYGNKP